MHKCFKKKNSKHVTLSTSFVYAKVVDVRRIENAWVSKSFKAFTKKQNKSTPSAAAAADDNNDNLNDGVRGPGVAPAAASASPPRPPPSRVRGLFCVAPPRSLERVVAFGAHPATPSAMETVFASPWKTPSTSGLASSDRPVHPGSDCWPVKNTADTTVAAAAAAEHDSARFVRRAMAGSAAVPLPLVGLPLPVKGKHFGIPNILKGKISACKIF